MHRSSVLQNYSASPLPPQSLMTDVTIKLWIKKQPTTALDDLLPTLRAGAFIEAVNGRHETLSTRRLAYVQRELAYREKHR